ncbi:phospholipasecarboxylesterase [Fragilaria crotonensis]|nr:phospholipasecarboxylesterase [Fragilaria crotonensis]
MPTTTKGMLSLSSRPAGWPNTNLLILLHGAGDTHIPFDKLGQTMALPQTATLALSARGAYGEPLPLQLGYTWFQEMDYTTGAPLPESQRQRSLHEAASKFCQFLHQLIVQEQWIIPERVFLLGYGAGGALAMQVCVLWNTPTHQQHNAVPRRHLSVVPFASPAVLAASLRQPQKVSPPHPSYSWWARTTNHSLPPSQNDCNKGTGVARPWNCINPTRDKE